MAKIPPKAGTGLHQQHLGWASCRDPHVTPATPPLAWGVPKKDTHGCSPSVSSCESQGCSMPGLIPSLEFAPGCLDWLWGSSCLGQGVFRGKPSWTHHCCGGGQWHGKGAAVGMELQLGVLPCPQPRGWDIPRGVCGSPRPRGSPGRSMGSHPGPVWGALGPVSGALGPAWGALGPVWVHWDLSCGRGRAGWDEEQDEPAAPGRSPRLGAAVASLQCAWHRLSRLALAESM